MKANEFLDEKELQIEVLTKKLQSAQQNISMLQHQVEQLLRRIYGRGSERLFPNQLMFERLVLKALEQPMSSQPPVDLPVAQEPKTKPRQTTKRQHPGRIPISEHLERVEMVLDIPEKDKVCPETGKPLKRTGWEVSEKLEYRPGKLIVKVHKRPKYAPSDSASELGVITAPMGVQGRIPPCFLHFIETMGYGPVRAPAHLKEGHGRGGPLREGGGGFQSCRYLGRCGYSALV
jgi:transposase